MREDVLVGIKPINQRGSAEGLRQELDGGIETTRQPIATSRDLALGLFAINGRAAATITSGSDMRRNRQALVTEPCRARDPSRFGRPAV